MKEGNKMEAYIITGASKGIGLALSRQLAGEGHAVLGIARSIPEDWPGLQLFPFDLSAPEEIPSLMEQIVEKIPDGADSVTLINNAGTIDPIGFAHQVDPQEAIKSISLNLTAPMILCNSFLKQLEGNRVAKRIVNVSSGAGRNAYKGWSVYCTGKAGLDHFSVCLDNEYGDVKVVSVAPGIIDTDMQGKIRESSEEEFPLIDNFKEYKEKGMLSTPEETASKLIGMLQREDFDLLSPILDIRNL